MDKRRNWWRVEGKVGRGGGWVMPTVSWGMALNPHPSYSKLFTVEDIIPQSFISSPKRESFRGRIFEAFVILQIAMVMAMGNELFCRWEWFNHGFMGRNRIGDLNNSEITCSLSSRIFISLRFYLTHLVIPSTKLVLNFNPYPTDEFTLNLTNVNSKSV